jgi:hypothetical protein
MPTGVAVVVVGIVFIHCLLSLFLKLALAKVASPKLYFILYKYILTIYIFFTEYFAREPICVIFTVNAACSSLKIKPQIDSNLSNQTRLHLDQLASMIVIFFYGLLCSPFTTLVRTPSNCSK